MLKFAASVLAGAVLMGGAALVSLSLNQPARTGLWLGLAALLVGYIVVVVFGLGDLEDNGLCGSGPTAWDC